MPKVGNTYSSLTKESLALHQGSSLEDIVVATLAQNPSAENSPKKLPLLLYRTQSDSKKLSRQLNNSHLALSTLSSKTDLNLSLALHFVFDIFIVDVDNSDEKYFKNLSPQKAPLIVIADPNGKLLEKITASSKQITTSRVYQALAKAAKKLKINLKNAVKKENKILNDLIRTDNQLKSEQGRFNAAKSGSAKKTIQKKIDKYQKKFNELVEEEKELWKVGVLAAG